MSRDHAPARSLLGDTATSAFYGPRGDLSAADDPEARPHRRMGWRGHAAVPSPLGEFGSILKYPPHLVRNTKSVNQSDQTKTTHSRGYLDLCGLSTRNNP